FFSTPTPPTPPTNVALARIRVRPFCIIAPFYGLVDVNFVAETKLTIKTYEKSSNHFSETRKTVIINHKQQA
ncbi:MAG: hypothetical protein K2I02_06815, partial [Duncaniella sp.]|nr:hypothetical protein [Duncaniella sp.]